MNKESDEKNEVQDMKVALKFAKDIKDGGVVEKLSQKPIPKKIITFNSHSQENSGLKLDL